VNREQKEAGNVEYFFDWLPAAVKWAIAFFSMHF
jgi:hypothetical protein